VSLRSGTSGAALAVATAIGAVSALGAEPALPIPVLVCQQTIGNEALRFVARAHKAARRCLEDEARGRPCDAAKRDAAIADAEAKLARRYASRCDAAALASLGFPGSCSDPEGAPFTVAELTTCVVASHRETVGTAVATALPGEPGPFAGAALGCRRAIGGAAEQFLTKRLRARQSCRNDQLSGAIDPAVACGAAPPSGAGTGHRPTDRRLETAGARLAKDLARRCTDVPLAVLGFPGQCADADGPPFALVDLTTCLRDGHAGLADLSFALEYPE
jgi:hypothetical protein